MATQKQPLKVEGQKSFLPRIADTLKGWTKADPQVQKKLPVESDVVEYLVKCGLAPGASAREQTVGDWTLIAFYYLLRVGEYDTQRKQSEMRASKLCNSG